MTKNFSAEEFKCKCGCDMPREVEVYIDLLATELQKIRDYYNAPITVNSAYRCISHNRSIGSKDSSQHTKGKAVDFTVRNISPNTVADDMEYLIKTCGLDIGAIGRYDTFTHIDMRDANRLIKWDNRR